MSILLLFISLFIGIKVRASWVLGSAIGLLSVGFSYFRFRNVKYTLVSLAFLLFGVGISFIRPDFNKETYQSLIVEVKDNYYIASSSFEKLYVYEKEHTHEVGDIVRLTGYKKELDFNKLESDFDFKKYLNNKGVYSRLVVTNKEIVFSNFIKINAFKNQFLSHFDDDTRGCIKSILFGGGDDSETYEAFKDLHLTRIISNSGIHLDIIFSLTVFLLSYFLKDKTSKIIGLVVLGLYSLLTFPRYVVIKFLFLHILRFINDYPLKKKFNYIEILSALGIVSLLIDYHLAYQDGFLLTYFIPLLALVFNGSFKGIKEIFRKLLTPVIISIAFIPFASIYYHEISIFSLFLQILFTPFLVVLLILSLISLIGIPIYFFINLYTSSFLGSLLSLIGKITPKIYCPPMNGEAVFFYEFLYVLILYFISIKYKDFYKVLLIIYSSIMGIYLFPLSSMITSFVSFINVGQGDATLIHYANNTVLIDTGGIVNEDIARSCLIPYLKSLQIYDIDLLITTHDDFDHMGGRDSLIRNFKVKNYINDYSSFPLTLGNITFTNYNVYPDLWNEENDVSLVIGFSMKEHDYLIMGDAPKKIENKIVEDHQDLRCDILKVGHHGSNTSTSDKFISTIKPKIAIISCGKNNKYGHPNKETINILNKYKVVIRRTDYESTIKFSYFL